MSGSATVKTPSGISRRLRSAFLAHAKGEYEDAFIHLFAAIDKTAKPRRPKSGVGNAQRSFFREEEGLISILATGSLIPRNTCDEVGFPEAMYKSDGRALLMRASSTLG